MDTQLIKNLMLLWLVINTKIGPDHNFYWFQLTGTTGPAIAAREELAKSLKLPQDMVDKFIAGADDPTTGAQQRTLDTQDFFHTLVKAVLPPGNPYEGFSCPKAIAPITDLVP